MATMLKYHGSEAVANRGRLGGRSGSAVVYVELLY